MRCDRRGMTNFDRPDRATDDIGAITAYTIARVRESDPEFADRIEGAWRAMMEVQYEPLLPARMQ